MRRTGSASIGNVDGVNPRSDPEEFVTKFAGFWEDPSPQWLPELLHPNVVLVQPLAARMIGIQAAQAEFQRIWSCLPDLRAHVDRWCGDGDLVFIEFRLYARIGGKVTEWGNVNRLVLHDGKVVLYRKFGFHELERTYVGLFELVWMQRMVHPTDVVG